MNAHPWRCAGPDGGRVDWGSVDDRDPGDEDCRPVGSRGYRGAQFADELDALADVGTNPAVESLIRKLAEGKLK